MKTANKRPDGPGCCVRSCVLNTEHTMPRSSRAPGKRRRLPKTTPRIRRIVSLALDIEEPLTDAADYVRALRLIGHGIMLDDSGEGRAVAAIACAATDRLDSLRGTWKRLLKVARS